MAEREGLGDRQRAVDEVGGGGDERQLDPVARQRVEREQSFESGDAAAGNNNAMRSVGHEFTRVVGQVRYGCEARISSASGRHRRRAATVESDRAAASSSRRDEPALARLALERVDERQGDGRGGSELDPDLGAQAVQARERRPSDDRAVAVDGDDGRMVERLGLGGSNDDGIGNCAHAAMVARRRPAAIGTDPPASCGRLRTAVIARVRC